MTTLKKELPAPKAPSDMNPVRFFSNAENLAEKNILSSLQSDRNSLMRAIKHLNLTNRASFLTEKHTIQHHQYTLHCTLFEYFYLLRDYQMCQWLATEVDDAELSKYSGFVSKIDRDGLEYRDNEEVCMVRKLDFNMLLSACKQYVYQHAFWSTKNGAEEHGHVYMFAMLNLIRKEYHELPHHVRFALDSMWLDKNESFLLELNKITSHSATGVYPAADEISLHLLHPLENLLHRHESSLQELKEALSLKPSVQLKAV